MQRTKGTRPEPGEIPASIGRGEERRSARVTDGTADEAEAQLRVIFQKPSGVCVCVPRRQWPALWKGADLSKCYFVGVRETQVQVTEGHGEKSGT